MNHGTCTCTCTRIRQLVMRCRQSMAAAIVLIVPLAGFHVAAARDSAALPELTIVDHVAHYTVTGTSVRSIRAQLESRSQTGGESRHGSTRSTFEVISKLGPVSTIPAPSPE